MRKVLLFVICLSAGPALHAMTWQELQAEIDSVESGNPSNRDIIVRFSEVVQMLVTYNKAVQERDPAARLFCPSPNGSLQLDEIVSMVRGGAERAGSGGGTRAGVDAGQFSRALSL